MVSLTDTLLEDKGMLIREQTNDSANDDEYSCRWLYLSNLERSVQLNDSIHYVGGYSDYSFDTTTDSDHSVAANSGLDWSKLYLNGVPVSLFTGHTLTPSYQRQVISQARPRSLP